MKALKVKNIKDLEKLASQIKQKIKLPTLILLFGEVGVGKTTFTKALAKEFGLDPLKVKSPTFTLINSYVTPIGFEVHHIDLYRIEELKGFFEGNLQEILENKNDLIIIEWPKEILPLLKDYSHFNILEIHFNYAENSNDRLLTIKD